MKRTICGSQQIIKSTESVAMRRLKATSSAVAALWGAGGAPGGRPACRRQLVRDTRRTAPPPRVIAYSARITAKLQYTSTAHSSVPTDNRMLESSGTTHIKFRKSLQLTEGDVEDGISEVDGCDCVPVARAAVLGLVIVEAEAQHGRARQSRGPRPRHQQRRADHVVCHLLHKQSANVTHRIF